MKIVPPTKQYLNECNGCKHRWVDWPGMHAEFYEGCPNCGGLYWTPIVEIDPRTGEEKDLVKPKL
jgi:hypothetical protein